MNNEIKRKTLDKKSFDTNNPLTTKKINKKPNEKQIKLTNDKEIKIEEDLDDFNVNRDKNLSSTNKSNLQKLRKGNEIFALNSTPKSSLKTSLNEKTNKYNTNITTFNSSISNSQNTSKFQIINNKSYLDKTPKNVEISKKNLQGNFNNISDKPKNYQETISSFSNQTNPNKNPLNTITKSQIINKETNVTLNNTNVNVNTITTSGLNSSHNDDSCSISQTNNISLNSNESIFSSPSKKLSQIKSEKIEEFKKTFEQLENLLNFKLKNNLSGGFLKLKTYTNSEFAIKFEDLKNKINDFLNNYSLLVLSNENNLSVDNNDSINFNTVQIHNYFTSVIYNLKIKLDIPINNEITIMNKQEEILNQSNIVSQEFIADNEFNISAISEDCLFEYENVRKNNKTNSLCFEIPIKRDRAMSENDESLLFFNSLKGKEKESNAKDNSSYFNSKADNFANKNIKDLENFEKMNHINPLKIIKNEIDFGKESVNYNSSNNSNLNSVKGKNFEMRFSRLNKKTRLSSEEIQKRINEKLEQAEKNKNDLKRLHTEHYNKTMRKIKDIKIKKKVEKIEKMQKLYKKIEKFNQRHQEYLNEKLSKVKSENEKIAEIKFLLKIDKENKNLNLLKKLDISIDRRKKHIEQRLWKTKLRNKREEELLKSTNIARDDSSNSKYNNSMVDDIKVKFFKKIKINLENVNNDKTNDLISKDKKNLKNENNKSNKSMHKNNIINSSSRSSINVKHNENCSLYKTHKSSSSKTKSNNATKNEDNHNLCSCNKEKDIKVDDKSNRIIYNQKKQKIEENFEFIRTIYSENFIWELLEADYFDIDELCELSQLTKFELLKSKLKKDKEKIDKLYENKTNSNLKNDLNKNILNPNTFSNINIYCNINNKISNVNTSLNNNSNNNNLLNSNISPFHITSNNKKQSTVNTDSINSYINENEKNYFNFEEQILANDSEEKDSFYLESQKKSRSFMHFDENDFIDYEYLFNDISTKKTKKKRKKKTANNENLNDANVNNFESNSVNNDDTDKIKSKLIKTINSMSQKTISTLYKSINSDNSKMKNYLVKSKNGKYLKSRIQIRNEEFDIENKNLIKLNNENINKISTSRIKEKENDSKSTINITKKQQSSNNLTALTSHNNIITDNSNKKQNDSKLDSQNSNNLIEPQSESITNRNKPDFKEEDSKNFNILENIKAEDAIEDEKENVKDKLIKDIVSNNDIINILGNNNSGNNTLMINSESVSKIIEQNAISVKWCKLCNVIIPSDQDSNIHLSKYEHKRLKNEYGITLQDDSNFIMVFQSLPGDVNEDLKNERINSIKLRFKKIKQKLSLRAVKHENFWSYKQDFPSENKQRLQKISFEIEKQIFPNIKDYDALENNLKETTRILDKKKINDLHIMRQTKIIHCLVEVLKKPAVCHKGEIKNLGKILEHVVKILSSFSTLLENRNYMIVTNRLSVINDLLLWILNKPSKIPLGISFLPDLIYLITIHIKHRIPFEHLCMKDDFIEYVFLSNILVKFKQKYCALVGPIDLTTGFGSFPLFLLKSLGMLEAITSQININYCAKPVYIRTYKISDNILFVIEHTDFIGTIQLLYTLLLSEGPIKPKSEKDNNKVVLPSTVITASILAVKILNNIARIDICMFQSVYENNLLQDQIYHIICYIINYSLDYIDSSDDIKELLHESLLLINYITLRNEKLQNIFSRGEITAIQRVSSLPFNYFCDKKLKDILFPTLISMTYLNNRNLEILNKEINLEMLIIYLKEKIQLEPINEEEEVEKLDESRDDLLLSFNRDLNIKGLTGTPENMLIPSDLKKRTMSISSSASSTKSCHDMITGVSDFVLLYHRFPRNLWENALDFYKNFNQSDKN